MPNFDPRMALEGPTGDFAGEFPEAPNAHLTSLPNAKKDMLNVGRRQCLEKRNTGLHPPGTCENFSAKNTVCLYDSGQPYTCAFNVYLKHPPQSLTPEQEA
jgi:hypothetical protein